MRVPKYRAIEEELRKEIQSGKFEYGDLFYSESELARRFEVSSITVIRAIRDLVTAGYLVRYQGKGTFVTRSRKRQLVEFTDLEVFNERAEEETVDVLSMEPGEDPEVREILKLSEEEGYYRIVRVRRIQGVPYMLHVSHIPSRFIKPDVDPSYYTSIYTRFKDDFDLHLYDEHSSELNEIVYPAPDEVAELLEGDQPLPCVRQTKVTTLPDDTVAEYVIGYKRWDYYRIQFSTYEPNAD